MEEFQKYFFQTTFHHHIQAKNIDFRYIFHFEYVNHVWISHVLCVNDNLKIAGVHDQKLLCDFLKTYFLFLEQFSIICTIRLLDIILIQKAKFFICILSQIEKRPEDGLFALHVQQKNKDLVSEVIARKIILASGAYVNINSVISDILPEKSALFFFSKKLVR